jgi:hypothetical protein
MPDRQLPEMTDPQVARQALAKHLRSALEGYTFDYDGDRTVYVAMQGTRSDGNRDDYLVRLTFLYYPTWPPSVVFVNSETKQYEGVPAQWPKITGSPRMAFYPSYGDAPAGMVCNSMTFEYYFWGGHAPSPSIQWKAGVHTFAATIAELTDHLRPPYYIGRAS